MKKIIIVNLISLCLLMSQKVEACTVVFSNDGENIYVGNNEDFSNQVKPQIWFTPSSGVNYGCVLWGFDFQKFAAEEIPQGGMNEKGLFFDGTSVPEWTLVSDSNKENVDHLGLVDIFKTSATVEEVVSKMSKLNLVGFDEGQIFIADKTGDYAVIENNVITRKADKDDFVAANFRTSHPEMGGYPSIEYTTANKLFEQNAKASVQNFENILNAVHDANYRGSTIYSNICDLKNGIVTIYQRHNFENSYTIDLVEELKKGKHSFFIKDLFPKRISPKVIKIYDKKGLGKALELMNKLKDDTDYGFCESELHEFSLYLKENNKYADALTVTNLAIENYPNSDIAFYNEGIMLLLNGMIDEALVSFKKALQLNQLNEEVAIKINQIETPVKEANTIFRLNGYNDAKIVTLIMNVDYWKNLKHIMYRDGKEWIYNIDLEEGNYEYIFLVDGEYILDPNNSNTKEYPSATVNLLKK